MKAKGEFETVRQLLEKALQLDPNNKFAQREHKKVVILLKAEEQEKLDDAIMELSARKANFSRLRNCNCTII